MQTTSVAIFMYTTKLNCLHLFWFPRKPLVWCEGLAKYLKIKEWLLLLFLCTVIMLFAYLPNIVYGAVLALLPSFNFIIFYSFFFIFITTALSLIIFHLLSMVWACFMWRLLFALLFYRDMIIISIDAVENMAWMVCLWQLSSFFVCAWIE